MRNDRVIINLDGFPDKSVDLQWMLNVLFANLNAKLSTSDVWLKSGLMMTTKCSLIYNSVHVLYTLIN